MLALEKRRENQARLTFAKVRWQSRERHPYLLEFDPETETFSFVKEEESEERDYAAEAEDFLEGTAPATLAEIADGIGASKPKVKVALETTPSASTASPERRRGSLGGVPTRCFGVLWFHPRNQMCT